MAWQLRPERRRSDGLSPGCNAELGGWSPAVPLVRLISARRIDRSNGTSGSLAGCHAISGPSRRGRNALRCRAVLALLTFLLATTSSALRARADVGSGFIPFWVENDVRTHLWSGSDQAAADFGLVAQFSAFRVVAAQNGPRLFVYNPATRNYAYIDAAAVGPSGPLLQPLTVERQDSTIATIRTELAWTVEALQFGLMGRRWLPADASMLFVMPPGSSYAFWMDHTSIPLSIAFLGGSGTIIGIQDMRPFTVDLHSPGVPFAYALEVNQGWFAQNRIAAGDTMRFPAWLPRSS